MDIFAFTGRINRVRYLLLSLLPLLVFGVLFALGLMFGHPAPDPHAGDAVVAQMNEAIKHHHSFSWSSSSSSVTVGPPGLVSAIVFFVAFVSLTWIGLAAQVRRFHDLGQTGWFVLLNLIPGAGFIIWLVLVLASGQTSPNSYGATAA